MAHSDTIAELFRRDPFTLVERDIDTMIEYFRERRADFKLGVRTAPERVEKPKASLEDLGL